MRAWLDRLYDAAAYVAAFFMVGVLAAILLSIAGRLFHFHLGGTDAYAGYSMAGAAFLALAHTLKRGEHIRVTLVLEHVGPRLKRALELWCHAAGTFLTGLLAFYSARLVWQSHTFNDISQGTDATPLWIPQLVMALGSIVLLIAMVDELIVLARRGPLAAASADAEPARIE